MRKKLCRWFYKRKMYKLARLCDKMEFVRLALLDFCDGMENLAEGVNTFLKVVQKASENAAQEESCEE